MDSTQSGYAGPGAESQTAVQTQQQHHTLPFTGFDAFGVAGFGLVLVGAGVAIHQWINRRVQTIDDDKVVYAEFRK